MNKLLVKVLLSLAMMAAVFSLSACDGKTTEPTTTEGTTVTQTTAEETATVADTTADDSTSTTQTDKNTTDPTNEDPDETVEPELTIGQTVIVSKTATNFGSKSHGLYVARFVPGYTFTVYNIVDGQALIGLDGSYTGWMNIADISGYESATPAEPDEPTDPSEPTTTPAVTTPATTKPATTKPTTTAPDTSIKAPVSGSITKIVSFYNQYATELRNYSGKVVVKKSDGTVTVINSISGGSLVKNLALDLLPNDYSADPTRTYTNGKSGNKTLAKELPRGDQSSISVLQPAGVSSATCVTSGSGWKVTIALKTESVNSLSGTPTYTSQCMDTLELSEGDLDPFTLKSAKVTYANCKIVAVMDSLGRITKLDVTTPATITGKLKYGFIGIDADITGNYKGNYTFAY
jgi:hypothetical protein